MSQLPEDELERVLNIAGSAVAMSMALQIASAVKVMLHSKQWQSASSDNTRKNDSRHEAPDQNINRVLAVSAFELMVKQAFRPMTHADL